MGKVIVLTSGKGGTGKTTCTATIAETLALLGKRTVAVDCDIGLRNLDLALGLADASVFDFADVLASRVSLDEAVIAHPEIENLYFLPAPADREDIDPASFRNLTHSLAEAYDYVLVDSPAGIGSGFRLAVSSADMAIVVATGDATCLRDGQKTVMELTQMGVGEIRLLVNRVKPRHFRKLKNTVDDVIDTVGARLLGVIREDDSVQLASNKERPLMLCGARYAYDEFYRIARRLAGERVYIGRI